MIIYTDDKQYAAKIFPDIESWELFEQGKISINNSFVCKILPSKHIYFSEVKLSNFWQYLFITKHSHLSQFDLLNSLCRENIDLPDGILCLADSGSKFHGYRDRKWSAQSGNLHLSILKQPNQPVKKFHIGFTILAAISVVQTLDYIFENKNTASIKWVNDILIDKAKISGVITQTQSQKDIVTAVTLGIGLNIENAPSISNDSFVGKATCLYDHVTSDKISFSEIFSNLIEKIESNYQLLLAGEYQKLLEMYRKYSIILNRKVEIYSDTRNGESSLIASGKVIKIGDELELYIETIPDPIRQGRLKLI